MNKEYHIFLIEDNEADAERIRVELSKVDLDIHLSVIDTKEELQARLSKSPPALIICKWNLSNWIGLEALKIARNVYPTLPFIFVSDNPAQEKAVQAIRKGASDYVTMGNINRLGVAILKVILEFEDQQQKPKQVQETESRYQTLMQSVDGIFWEADAQTFEFSYVSPQSEKIVGYSCEEWLSTPEFWKNHIHPEDQSDAINFCHHHTQQGNDHSFEYRMIAANQKIVWLRDYVTVSMKNGKPDRLRGFMVDISKQKRAEKQRDKAYQIANIGHWELDTIKNELYWSENIKELHEVSPSYQPTLEGAIKFYKEGEHRQRIIDAVDQAIKTGKPFNLELKIVTAKENERWIRALGEAEIRGDTCVKIFGSTQDITTRKQAEIQLKNTEHRLRDIIENSTNMFYRHDTNHVLSYLSPQSKEFLGYPVEEAKRRWTQFATDHPINKKGFEITQKAINTGKTQPPYELQLRKKGGDIIWVLVNEAPIVENGQTVAIVGSLTDITNQKNYEEKLEQLSLVAAKTTDIIIITNENESIEWVNNAFEEMTGYQLDEVIGKKPGDLLQGPDTDPQTVKRIAKQISNLETVQEVILNYAKNGRKYWLDITIDPILDEDGNCTGYIAIERDVTAEIERNQKMQENIERYDIVSEATSDTIWDLDLRTDTMQYNQNIYNMFGYQKEEVDKLSKWWKSKIHPADQNYVQDKLDEALSSNDDRIQFEYRFKCADGTYKYIYDRAFVVRNNEEPIRIIGAMQDITTFKEREHRSRKFQEVVSNLATDRSLQQMDILDAISNVLTASAQTLEVERVNMWILEDQQLRCVYSYNSGEINTMRGKILTQKEYPTYFSHINEQRIIAAPHPKQHEAFTELCDSYIIPENIQSILDTSVHSYGSTQAVVCHESVNQKRNWESDEISFAGAITDQISQLLASQEKKERDKAIRESLKEKETLLAEVHHRVKNNLAVVSGMMQLQAYEEDNEDLKYKLFDSVARIQTMAAIHELLYQSNSFSNLRLDKNIEKLITSISDTLQTEADIELQFDLDPITLNVNQAIPCSLIINEVVTNALKHAFDKGSKGAISIELTNKNNSISLTISDDGKGLPQDAKTITQKGSLGFKLIDTLTTQLGGDYTFNSGRKGTEFLLTFKKAKIKGIGSAHLE